MLWVHGPLPGCSGEATVSDHQLATLALAFGFLAFLFLLMAGCIADSGYPRGTARPWFIAFLAAFAVSVGLVVAMG